jgi:predicted ester cyclase
MEVPSCTECW